MSWRRKVLLGVRRFFPAYTPGLLIVIKWVVLGVFGKYTLANTIVDVPFASLSFAIWVITKPQPQPALDAGDDKFLGIVSLLVNPVLYFVGVWAWIVSPDALITRFIVSGLAVVLFFLVPCVVLGPLEDRSTPDGGIRG